MKETIREYFKNMLADGFDLESATNNLMNLVAEIATEFFEDKDED